MKFLVLGTSAFAISCAKGILDSKESISAFISLEKRLLPNNSVDTHQFCQENNIEHYETNDINDRSTLNFVIRHYPDYIISSWPKIISAEFLQIPNNFVIGSHPTPLPMNRGRHPLHWMIALGIPNSVLSFFIMDAGIDTGNILLQTPFLLGEDINTANENLNNCGNYAIRDLIKLLRSNPDFEGYHQTSINSNYWRKRTEFDVTLDPRMNYQVFSRIVNSFLKPYPGARLYVRKDIYLTVIKVQISDHENIRANWRNLEYGFVLGHKFNILTMKIDDAIVDLYLAEEIDRSKIDNLIHPPMFYLTQ